MINAHPCLARDQSLPCKSALNGNSRRASTAGVEILAWRVNDVSTGASGGRASPAPLGSFNTHGPDTKLSLSGAVQKHCLCGLSAQITLVC